MFPAMDRVLRTLARRSPIGLALAVTLLDLGCARLNWHRQAPEPPMLGRMSDTTDIYAMDRRPGPSSASPATAPAGSSTTPPARDDAERPAKPRPDAEADPSADEPAMTKPTTELPADPAEGGVALQAPTPLNTRLDRRPSRAAVGVPNAGLVLASAERRPAAGPARSPAEVVAEARAALDSLASYEVSLHRQERVNGTLLPEEDLVISIRRDPRAVRLTWPSGSNRGREVLYRADEPGGQMHVKMANPALPRLALAPESPLVMRNSRHPVTEAGFDSIVEGLENSVRAADRSGITYAGQETPEGLDRPHDCLLQTSPTGDRWRIYLDPANHLPSLVIATGADGQLLERYLFHDVRPNLEELAANEAFDANARWGPPRGLFGRASRDDSTATSATPR